MLKSQITFDQVLIYEIFSLKRESRTRNQEKHYCKLGYARCTLWLRTRSITFGACLFGSIAYRTLEYELQLECAWLALWIMEQGILHLARACLALWLI